LELQGFRAGCIQPVGADRKDERCASRPRAIHGTEEIAVRGIQTEEATLNRLGYTLLFSGQTQDAIAVFQRNMHEFPKSVSVNVYDSLAEAYMKADQKDLAIQNYELSLQLDPKNQNAVDRLKKLKETK